MTYQLPDLPYDFDALEPVISKEIMELHYTKHHKAYVTNLNQALDKYREAEEKGKLAEMVALQSAIRFNGGGHINHSLFWTTLLPPSRYQPLNPHGKLQERLTKDFGGFAPFQEMLSASSVACQGSGWGWLGYDPLKKNLRIVTCSNQDPLSTLGLVPLLGIDVWEHAYYLQYKNVRADYVKAIWQILDWAAIEKRFLDASSC